MMEGGATEELWTALSGVLMLMVIGLAAYAWRMRQLWKLASRKYLALKQEYAGSANVLTRRSSTDALTGLANRRSFDESIAREWQRCRRQHETLALLMVDIDHFKKHNDSYGHQAGDDCLRTVARTLAATARRSGDLPARYGGEEFSVLLTGSTVEGALALAERIRQAIEQIRLPYMDSADKRHVSVSIGVAVCIPSEDSEPTTLIAAADRALYQAKAVGRNQVIVAHEPLPKSA